MPVKTIENPEEFRANIAAKLSPFFVSKGGSEKHAANLEKAALPSTDEVVQAIYEVCYKKP